MGKKRIYVALSLIALAMLGICFFYLKKTGWGMTGDKAWNELLDLDKNVTVEQLEAKGYINVTGCLDEENETISEFIDNAGNRRKKQLCRHIKIFLRQRVERTSVRKCLRCNEKAENDINLEFYRKQQRQAAT